MNGLERIVKGYVGLSERRPLVLLTLFLAVTAVSLWAVTTLKVNTNFRTLLPQNTPSVRALEESEIRRGSVELYTIAVESPDPIANAWFLEELAAHISTWEEAVWVQVDDDPSFFQDNVLLYMPVERLDAFRDALSDAVNCELAAANPFFVDLSGDCDEESDVEWTFDYWIGDNLARDVGVPEDFFGDLESQLEGGSSSSSAADPRDDDLPDWAREPEEPEEPEDPEGAFALENGTGSGTGLASAAAAEAAEAAAPVTVPTSAEIAARIASGPPRPLDHYISNEEGTVGLIYVQLNQPAIDMSFANAMTDRGTALIAELDPSRYHPEARAQVVGAYENLRDAQEAVGDSMTALYASLGMVLLAMLVFFRAIRGILVVVVPLLMGVAWTMGLTRLTYVELNIYTLFVGSVLIGMGIDFGIHLYGRALEGFRDGLSWPKALEQALIHTGTAILASAITTVGALLTLLFSHFQGFKEFGVVASYGVIFCMLASYLVVPPMVFVFERVAPLKRRARRRRNRRVKPGAKRFWVATTAAMILIITGCATMLDQAAFEYDFRNYRTKHDESDVPPEDDPNRPIHYGQAVGRGRASAPALMLGESESQMREAHRVLRDLLAEEAPYLKGFVTIETFVPPEQEERMRVIRRIKRMVNRRAMSRLTGGAGDFIDVLRERVEVEPFGLDAVPSWALHIIEETDGSVGAIGLFYSRVNTWDIQEVWDYQRLYQNIEVPSGTVTMADSKFINADIITTVQADGERIALIVVGMLVVVLLIALRSVRGTVICLLTLAGAMLLAVGAMVVTDTKVGMFNMIVLPAVLGVSIDGAIHLYHRYREEGTGRVRRVLLTTGVAVAAASITTAAGFGGLVLQNHQGIASIGRLAVIGILAALVALFGLMPGLLVLFVKPKKRRAES